MPDRGQPQGGVYHPGQHGGRRAQGDGGLRQERAGFVTADADAAAVEPENVLIIGGVLRHIGDPAAAGVGLGHQGIVDEGQGRFRQKVRQHVGHLGPGGRLGQLVIQSLVQHPLGLEIPEVGGIGPLGPLQLHEGGGARLRVPGAVQAADASGEDHRLAHGHVGRQAVGAVGLAYGQAVFIQGGYVFVKGVVLRQVGELAGVGFAAGEVVRAVFRRQNGDIQQGQRQKQGENTLFHSTPFRGSAGEVQILRRAILYIGVQVGIDQRQSFVRIQIDVGVFPLIGQGGEVDFINAHSQNLHTKPSKISY